MIYGAWDPHSSVPQEPEGGGPLRGGAALGRSQACGGLAEQVQDKCSRLGWSRACRAVLGCAYFSRKGLPGPSPMRCP